MSRRTFLKGSVAAVASGVAAPAIAQSAPQVSWRLTSSFPKSLDSIYGGAETLAKAVAEATDNRFQIQVFAPGEIVGGLQALDAVSNGTIEMCHTASAYYVGKDASFAFGSVVPFAFNARQMHAWYHLGGGKPLLDEFYAQHKVVHLPGGNTGCQMAGWFRREIKSVADFKGLKFRIPGLQGQVMAKLGAVPQQIAGADVYPALERGTIDAAEWVGPYDDEKLGFHRVAPFYYYPGWWEGGPMLNFFINQSKWNELPASYRSLLATAAERAHGFMLATYDAKNPAALRRLIAAGAQLRPFPQDAMDAAFKATEELMTEIGAANPTFRRFYERLSAFRDEQYSWWQVAELNFDLFMVRARAQRR
jgi:TRAP-type mannitol/chloroaromatic compound transport system substrate-binding protein